MIMDADVLFEPVTLRRMTRHLADPEVGGVTAYVKEGSQPAGLLSRFIAFEYITAQAAARRAQNVMGGLPCMAGGAQLHSRENLLAIGGAIDTSTLAEDTYTTFKTQLAGRRALFDANAVVWAEEPDSVAALWKQRVRWGRGNLQITHGFPRPVVPARPQSPVRQHRVRLPVVQHRLHAAVHDRGLGWRWSASSTPGRRGRRPPSPSCGASPSPAISSRRCSPSPSIRRRPGAAGSKASPFPACSRSAS